VTIGRVICSSAQVVSGVSAGRFEGGGRRANCASIVGPLPAIQRSRLSFSGRSRRADEPTPEGRAGEGALGASSQLLELLARVAPRLLGQQALEGVLEGPLALVKLGLRPALGNRLQHAAGGVADDPLGPSRQRGQKCAPVGRVGGREGLGRAKASACRPHSRPRRRRRRRPGRQGSAYRRRPAPGRGTAGDRARASPQPARRSGDGARRRPAQRAQPSLRSTGRGLTRAPPGGGVEAKAMRSVAGD
jgi:hypothetical protein